MLWFCEWGGGDGLMVGLNDLSDLSNLNISWFNESWHHAYRGFSPMLIFQHWLGGIEQWDFGVMANLEHYLEMLCFHDTYQLDITSWELLEIERKSAWSCFWWILLLLLVLAPHRAGVGVSVRLPSPPAVPASSCQVPLSTADVGDCLELPDPIALSSRVPSLLQLSRVAIPSQRSPQGAAPIQLHFGGIKRAGACPHLVIPCCRKMHFYKDTRMVILQTFSFHWFFCFLWNLCEMLVSLLSWSKEFCSVNGQVRQHP